MGVRFRKSINLGGGVRLNVSKKGVGVSAGGKGLRVSTGPSGSRMTTSVPGTGLYYEKRIGTRKTRSARQRQQELTKRQKEIAKQEKLEQAKYEVELYENKIELLQSVHKECSDPINWHEKKQSPPPFKDGEPGPNEIESKKALDQYKPTFRDRLFNRIEARKRILKESIEESKKEDELLYEQWSRTVELAGRILEKDNKAYLEVLENEAPFEDIKELGSSLSFKVLDDKTIETELHVHSETVVPDHTKTLTKTGKVSTRKMAKGKYYELYQDYVCSCVLRVAREVFALLPIQTAYIHALSEILDTATGHTEERPILSVVIRKESIEQINFDHIDCSDAIENMEHNMKFRKTKGFAPVEKIEPIVSGRV